MKRAAFTVLALLAAAPSAIAAQGVLTEEPLWGPRVRLTPFVGIAPTVARSERWAVSQNGTPAFGEYDVDLGSGPAFGGAVEVRLVDRFALIGAGYFIMRGETREYSRTTSEFILSEGSDFLIAKLTPSLRLREAASEMQLRRLTASVFAGPAWIREMPSDQGISPILGESITHWAANFGVDAEIPLGSGDVAIQLGLEDFLTFWNSSEIARRNDAVLAGAGLSAQSNVEADASNAILVRVGLSLRFR